MKKPMIFFLSLFFMVNPVLGEEKQEEANQKVKTKNQDNISEEDKKVIEVMEILEMMEALENPDLMDDLKVLLEK